MVVGFSYLPGTSATYTAQGYLQCTYERRAIVFRHEKYGERSSTDQLPKHWKILDRLCYSKCAIMPFLTILQSVSYILSNYGAEVEAKEEAVPKLPPVGPTKKLSKRRAFWSLNEDILKITILKTNTPYPSRKIRRIRACTHQRPQRNKDQYAVSRENQYAVFKIWNQYNILEDIKRGPYSKKSPIRRIQLLDMPYPTDFQTL
ncbi:hypothetical protein Tco_0655068 [Tanacetum coccineum]|uniref:Uncharacterized protein n=1 Tax=Tanacetum coccineum TaxID=301880 RepID=A0ABQ4X507_9ASTR